MSLWVFTHGKCQIAFHVMYIKSDSLNGGRDRPEKESPEGESNVHLAVAVQPYDGTRMVNYQLVFR